VTLFGLVFTPVFYMLVRQIFPRSVLIPNENLPNVRSPVEPRRNVSSVR
jgi:hypothetical protein